MILEQENFHGRHGDGWVGNRKRASEEVSERTYRIMRSKERESKKKKVFRKKNLSKKL